MFVKRKQKNNHGINIFIISGTFTASSRSEKNS